MLDSSRWYDYPMGPKLRSLLGISDAYYVGDLKPAPSEAQQKEFSDFLVENISALTTHDLTEACELIEELVMMRLGAPALAFSLRSDSKAARNDIRFLVAFGSAAMLAQDFSQAEEVLKRAKQLAPSELAPHNNLVQIYLLQNRLDECLQVCLAGLAKHINAVTLWEHLAFVYKEQFGETFGEKLLELAKLKGSWAGSSLAAQYCAPNDPMFRTEILQDLYDKGLRDFDFLCELTAAHGVSGNFAKIPDFLTEAEKIAQQNFTDVPWQLYAHTAQAHLGLEKPEMARPFLERALSEPNLPASARSEIKNLLSELTAH